jgi:hypothetical protein
MTNEQMTHDEGRKIFDLRLAIFDLNWQSPIGNRQYARRKDENFYLSGYGRD